MPIPFHGPASNQIRTAFALGALLLCPLAAASAQGAAANPDGVSDAQLKSWHENLKNYAPLESGCFQTSYPSVSWQEIACGPQPAFVSARAARALAARAAAAHGGRVPLETAGNGNDYVAQTGGITKSGLGTFPVAKGITSEKGVGVAAYGGGGILGKNEFSLQLNSDINPNSSACAAFGYSSCYVWEQFVYSTAGSGYPAEAFIQNWVFPSTNDYNSKGCPSGWQDASSTGSPACVVNSNATSVPSVAATTLGSLKLSGAAATGGKDTVVFTYGTKAYSATEADSTVHLGTWWKQSEFNVVGNAGGSEAVFNSGTTLGVSLVVHDGTTNAPSCLANSGTTGESNNLNLGKCTTTSGTSPAINFTESN